MPSVTIGFTPRERFSFAAEALQSLFDHTHRTFELIVVDCNIPDVYRRQMDAVLAGRENVKTIRTDRYLLPNQSRNLVLAEATGEYLCLTENDVIVQDGWLDQLIMACEEHPADVAIPLIIEGEVGASLVHFDDKLGRVEIETHDGEKRYRILPRKGDRQLDRGTGRRTVQFTEQHCVLFRRSVFDRIGPYDEELNTRDEIDLSMKLYMAGVPMVFEPRCEVFYPVPYPPRRDELEFFFGRWDPERAAASRERIRQKWNLVETPGSMDFIEDRNRIGHLHEVKDQLASLAVDEGTLLLVDDGEWRETEILAGLTTVPFLEHEGCYWGSPPDDQTAIAELKRMIGAGAQAIAFAWHTWWWLDHYSRFRDYLRSECACILENDLLLAFDLRPPGRR